MKGRETIGFWRREKTRGHALAFQWAVQSSNSRFIQLHTLTHTNIAPLFISFISMASIHQFPSLRLYRFCHYGFEWWIASLRLYRFCHSGFGCAMAVGLRLGLRREGQSGNFLLSWTLDCWLDILIIELVIFYWHGWLLLANYRTL